MIEQTPLGCSGMMVSRLALGTAGFGTWISERIALNLVHRAVGAGVSLIDTAEAYGPSEEVIGRALRGGLRDSCVVATKLSIDSVEAAADPASAVMTQAENSLRALRRERIDLLQLHEPAGERLLTQVLRALECLLAAGTVAWIGLCNHSAAEIGSFLDAAPGNLRARLVSVQHHLSLLQPQALEDVVPRAAAAGLTFMGWSPLGAGLLAHGHRKSPRSWMPWNGAETERMRTQACAWRTSAIREGADPVARALCFVWRSVPGSVAIAGPRTVAQLEHLIRIGQLRPSTAT
jgi:aryl-alcohol dehydrogenase-like predicted oxidoreductase